MVSVSKNKRKLLSSAMKMRKRSPLIPLGMQRKLLCANVFHDMEIRYVDIFASNRYAALKVPGNPGSRMLGRNGSSRRGLVRRTLLLRTRSLRMIGVLPRKEVIQPHLPVRLPCYDFTPLTLHTFDASAPRGVRPAASGADDSGGVTGGVYKARERIHRGVLIRDY